jgi:hypothetical protein
MTDARIPMIVQRDGYWDGQYPHAGETILVAPDHVEALTVAKFAVVASPPADPVRVAKGSKHGSR